MFSTVLVANRGEIARRIFRACRALGLRTVAVYSEADAGALHVREADASVLVGPAPARESYLAIDRIVAAAQGAGADAIHPGYGFLSENWRFAEACVRAGLTFVGPTPEAIRAMGDKTEARRLMQAAGVPIVPGSLDLLADLAEAERVGERDRVSPDPEGGRGRRGNRHGAGDCPERAGRRVCHRGPARAGRLRDGGPLSRALPGAAAPRGGPSLRGRSRHHHSPSRARVLDPAAPPEADRGVAGAAAGPEHTDGPRRGRGAGGGGHRLHQRRHHGIPGR